MARQRIQTHLDLDVYQMAFKAAMRIYRLSKTFPPEERYSLTDQIRKASRSICSNTAEAWRKRRYEGSFLLKLNDAEAEAAETQTWIAFAVECDYLARTEGNTLTATYDQIIGKLVRMIGDPGSWLINGSRK